MIRGAAAAYNSYHTSNSLCSLVILACALTAPLTGKAGTVYQNTFDDSGSLNDFTIYGEKFTSYNPPPLHSVTVENSQVRIDTDYNRPNGPTEYPVLLGKAHLSIDCATLFAPGYNTVLSQNSGLITWSFNVSNHDGMYNNSFSCVLASTKADPYNSEGGFAQGYTFNGGGMVGNRMAIRRFDYGMGGGGEMLIDVTEGLGPLPDKGSIRITFDPATAQWSLYATTGPDYSDPAQVNQLLGTAIDDTYTHDETRYFGLTGRTTGSTYFDNVSVDVVPEPATLLTVVISGLGAVFIRRRFAV